MTRPKRKAIPQKVKDAVFLRQAGQCVECGKFLSDKMEFDHRPAIILRPVNEDGTDYIPPQNDPDALQALHPDCHMLRTIGRLPGAAKTVTTKGSDAHLAAKFRRLEREPRRKAKIPSRPFAKGKRKFGQ